VVVETCFLMCGFCNVWVCVCVGFVMCVNFDSVCTCIYCIVYCLYCVLYCLVCVYFILFFVCTATE
jgi:hypothetical protein